MTRGTAHFDAKGGGGRGFGGRKFAVFVDVYHGFREKGWVFAVVCQGGVGFSSMCAKVLRF
jgi:hypothetical protein